MNNICSLSEGECEFLDSQYGCTALNCELKQALAEEEAEYREEERKMEEDLGRSHEHKDDD